MSRPQLHLISVDGDLDLRLNMGDGPATPTQGFSGYETVNRVRRVGMTAFVGTQPFAQDVPVMLDGFGENRSIERQLERLEEFGGATIFRAFGPIHRPSNESGLRYIFGDEPEFGEAIRAEDGTLIRQRLTLKLEQFVSADQAGKKQEPKIGVGKAIPLTCTTRKGDTLEKIAFRLYHDASRWKEIAKLNGLHGAHRVLPPGKELRLR